MARLSLCLNKCTLLEPFVSYIFSAFWSTQGSPFTFLIIGRSRSREQWSLLRVRPIHFPLFASVLGLHFFVVIIYLMQGKKRHLFFFLFQQYLFGTTHGPWIQWKIEYRPYPILGKTILDYDGSGSSSIEILKLGRCYIHWVNLTRNLSSSINHRFSVKNNLFKKQKFWKILFNSQELFRIHGQQNNGEFGLRFASASTSNTAQCVTNRSREKNLYKDRSFVTGTR